MVYQGLLGMAIEKLDPNGGNARLDSSEAGNGHAWVFLFYTEQLTDADSKTDADYNACDNPENNLGIHIKSTS